MSLESAVRAAQAFVSKDVPLVYIGEKTTGGQPTGQTAVVFGVVKKKPLVELRASEVLPRALEGEPTDVIEVGPIRALGYTQRVRPAPPGYSVGHPLITAGTLGAWVTRVGSTVPHLLSNSHVLANNNDASLGDGTLQPGPHDGGAPPGDLLASLAEWVVINFDGAQKKKVGGSLWRLAKWLPNTIARTVGCPNRLVLSTRAVPQPRVNLVDAAIAAVRNAEDVRPEFEGIGRLKGIRDLALGDSVVKWGRTTERTTGIVAGIRGQTMVEYGPGRMARFDDQIVIGPPGFSAPGDSGSAILTTDGYLGALLFAGSNIVTLANRASHVISLLGLAVP